MEIKVRKRGDKKGENGKRTTTGKQSFDRNYAGMTLLIKYISEF